jgi:hypothetical protein
MGKYFLNGREVPEPTAATHWFKHAGSQGVEVSEAINIWEDAATEQGVASRLKVAGAGIEIKFNEAD